MVGVTSNVDASHPSVTTHMGQGTGMEKQAIYYLILLVSSRSMRDTVGGEAGLILSAQCLPALTMGTDDVIQ